MEKTATLKGTLYRAVVELIPFAAVFFLFYGVYSLVGNYLLGPSIEMYSTIMSAMYTSFDMMNANIPIRGPPTRKSRRAIFSRRSVSCSTITASLRCTFSCSST